MKKGENIPFVLFANCLPVKGAERGAICDVQRGDVYLVPNSLIDFLEEKQKMTIREIKDSFPGESAGLVDEYFEYLVNNELIFFTDEPELFPAMELTWSCPSPITECIIDIGSNTITNLEQVFLSLDNLGCKALEIRMYGEVSLLETEQILRLADDSTITSISLVRKFDPSVSAGAIKKLCDQYKRITRVVVFGAEEDTTVHSEQLYTPIRFASQNIASEKCCGSIHPDFFSVHIETFTESLLYNSCLNRKIAIDSEGNIKNCPSMRQRFGTIHDTTLEEAVNMPGFKRFWHITKDQVVKCRDCEFRYICTDCRAYLDEPENPYSAPLKCGYDPYTCEWEEWSTHPMKQQAINDYGMREVL